MRLQDLRFFAGNGLLFAAQQAKQQSISHMGTASAQLILCFGPSGEGKCLSFPHGGLTGEQEY
jgi:hypothetical protein